MIIQARQQIKQKKNLINTKISTRIERGKIKIKPLVVGVVLGGG